MEPRYSILIRWSEDDQLYIASLPEFGDLCNTHGRTYEEAAKNGREVLEMLIESCEADGQPLPPPHLFHLPEVAGGGASGAMTVGKAPANH